jgi:hypothetical protein
MNGKTGGKRSTRCAGVLAVAAAVAVLATGCDVVHVHLGSSAGSASTESAPYRVNLAYAQCMRAHGLPGFPNPSPSQGFSFSGQLAGYGNSPAAHACRHLLPAGSRRN